jgi:hypothetical protein
MYLSWHWHIKEINLQKEQKECRNRTKKELMKEKF